MRIVVLCLLSTAIAACGGGESAAPPVDRESATLDMQQWSLPRRLDEISGLALTSDERLLAITDEIAVVYEIDYTDGGLVRAFAFGDPPVRADFEGIAVRDGTVWLMTSDGRLLAGPEGEDGEHVRYESFDAELRNTCELEGLSTDREGELLILICKEMRADRDLQMFAWNPDTGERQRFELPERDIGKAADKNAVNPSGIEVAADTGGFVVVAARQHVVFELSAEGRFTGAIMRLDKSRHRQAEGIAMTADGRLLIADEAGNGRARLAVYRSRHRE